MDAKEFLKEKGISNSDFMDSGVADLIETLLTEYHALQLQQTGVSGSTLLPDGWKIYKCTDCQEINVKKDNRQITVGFCDNCEHPLWNDDVD